MYSNTKIMQADIVQWINDFQKAMKMLKREGVLSDTDRVFIRRRISDALFLVAFVESRLGIDVEDEVYDRAKELQRAEQTEPRCEDCVYSDYDNKDYPCCDCVHQDTDLSDHYKPIEQTEPSMEEVLMGERDCETCKHDTDGGKGCWKCLAREEYNYEPSTDCSWK